MHYKNGREAHNGETVIGQPQYCPTPYVGIIQDINPGATSCNCTVIRPGGIIQSCVTVGDLYHVEDALAAIEAKTAADAAAAAEAPTPPPASDVPSDASSPSGVAAPAPTDSSPDEAGVVSEPDGSGN